MKGSIERAVRRFLPSLALLTATSSGFAFSFIYKAPTGLPAKWPRGAIPMKVMLGNTPALGDGSTPNSAFITATQLWNEQLGSVMFQATVSSDTAGDHNGINEAFFSSTIFDREFDPDTVAHATYWRSGSRITESDIIYNTRYQFDSYRGPRQSLFDIRRVALHELGHSLGLAHPNDDGQSVAAVMNNPIRDQDALADDDIAGGQSLYGPPGVPSNDSFANATVIEFPGDTTVVKGYNTNATKEASEPRVTLDPGGRSVWWRWTAPVSNRLVLDTRGSHFDTMVVVYAGTVLSILEPIVASYDIEAGKTLTSELTFNATAGTVYHISVDGEDSDSGGITMNLRLVEDKGTPPAIHTQPQNATVNAGENVTFTVTSTGTQPHSYQWLFNGTPMPGRTLGLLSLLRVSADQAGDYSVIVTNAAGSVTSATATLTVNTPSPPPPPPAPSSGGGGGGGGGAPSLWFVAVLALLAAARNLGRHARS